MGPKMYLVSEGSTDATASSNGPLYEGTTSDTSGMYYHHTSNTPEKIELPEIPTPKQAFEREHVPPSPQRRLVDKRARSMKFTQARVRR